MVHTSGKFGAASSTLEPYTVVGMADLPRAWGAHMEVEETEIIELASDRFIQLETYRQWPKLGVLWSVRRRAGESDFPLQQGSEEQIPASGQTSDEIWATLRESALAAARDAAGREAPSSGEGKRPSFLSRLFNRQ
jgi:hypothetical protein